MTVEAIVEQELNLAVWLHCVMREATMMGQVSADGPDYRRCDNKDATGSLKSARQQQLST